MSGREQDRRKRLLKLARWRTSQLENARTLHVRLAQTTAEKKSALDGVEAEIEGAHAYLREQLNAAGGLSPEAWRRFNDYAAAKEQDRESARTDFDKARAESDAAHAALLRRYESLSAVERLQERLGREAQRDLAQRSQKLLDEHALTKLSGTQLD